MSYAISAMYLQMGGIVSGGVGSYFSAKSNKATLDGQAAMADINARISDLGAQQELLNGQQQVGRLTLQAGQLKSSQRTNLAANGVDLGEGSAAEIQASTDIMKEIDKNTVEANAVRSAWGYRTQGMNYQNEATVKRGSAGGIDPGMSAFGSLLGSSGQVATSWYSINKNTGAFNAPSNGSTATVGQ